MRYHHIHQDLKDLQTRLGSLSATEADTLCRTVFDTYGAEDTDIDNGDFFLEQLGYQLSECSNETFVFQPPSDLPLRLAQMKGADLCDFAERLRQAWDWPAPAYPRGDYDALAQEIFHWAQQKESDNND